MSKDKSQESKESKEKTQESFDSNRAERGNWSNLDGQNQSNEQEMLTLDISYPRMTPMDDNFRNQIEERIREALNSADHRLLRSELDHEQRKY